MITYFPKDELTLADLVRELVTARGQEAVAERLNLTARALRSWTDDVRAPRRIYSDAIRAFWARTCRPEFRPLLTSFVEWGERNGLSQDAGLDALVLALLDVAANNEGCARCLHSRFAEGSRSAAPLLIRRCALNLTYPQCSSEKGAPLYIHPSVSRR